MKKTVLALMLLTSSKLFAQEMPKSQSLIEAKSKNTGYGALSTIFTEFNDEFAVFTGGYAGWYMNHKFMIGVGGYGMVTNHYGTVNSETSTTPKEYRMGYGGLVTEYTWHSDRLIHITTSTIIGIGQVTDGYDYINGSKTWENTSDVVFVSHTSLNAELNVTSWFRFGIGAGYRNVLGSDTEGMDDKDLSAFSGNVTLKFGGF